MLLEVIHIIEAFSCFIKFSWFNPMFKTEEFTEKAALKKWGNP